MASRVEIDVSKIQRGIAKYCQLSHAALIQAAGDIADAVAGEAKDLCPVDEGHLTEGITGEVQERDGKVAAVIKVPANHQSAPYAVRMHEGQYHLGALSQQKQQRVGKVVGRKYIERAVDSKREDIKGILKDAMQEV